jgi:hypothetical protein
MQKEKINYKGRARQFASDWQGWQAGQSLSYQELAARFDLVEDFKENGII